MKGQSIGTSKESSRAAASQIPGTTTTAATVTYRYRTAENANMQTCMQDGRQDGRTARRGPTHTAQLKVEVEVGVMARSAISVRIREEGGRRKGGIRDVGI